MLLKIILSGAVATHAMTEVMNIAPKVGLAKVDIASILGSLFNGGKSAERRTPQWLGGMALHYLLGALVFPVAYNTVFKRLLPGTPRAKRMEWSVGLWGVGQFAIMPVLQKYGYFKAAPDAKLTYLIGHLVYGLVFRGESQKR